jgi:tRNA (guanine37-N1)-methyltransferase
MSLRVDVLTLFPEAIAQYAATSVLGRAQERGVVELHLHDFRDGADDVHRSVDDAPFGGGAGMVLRAEPIQRTVESVAGLARPLIALTPSGRSFSHAVAVELSQLAGFSLLCGRYEGFDQRVLDLTCDDEISLGDFVLSGGELAALCVIEAVVRLRPSGLGNDESTDEESFADGLLEYPHYTQPAQWRGLEVPEVLRSGDHARVMRWRRAQSLRQTMSRRPDLIERRGGLTSEDEALLEEFASLDGEVPSG